MANQKRSAAPHLTAEQATEYLDTHWKHCLRCPLCNFRTMTDAGSDTYFGVVPRSTRGDCLEEAGPIPKDSTWHFMLECPDPEQQRTGLFSPVSSSGDMLSRNAALLEATFDALSGSLPARMEDCSYSFALGCRSVDFLNTQRLTKPSATSAKKCKPRWALELGVAAPTLTYLSGEYALGVVRPDLRTKGSKLLGEVVSIPVLTVPSPEMRPEISHLWGYVGPSIEKILRLARDDQFEQLYSWDGKPSNIAATEPVKDWLWHFYWYLWLTEGIESQVYRGEENLPSTLLDAADTLNKFYDEKAYNKFDISKFMSQMAHANPLDVRKSMTEEEEDEEEHP